VERFVYSRFLPPIVSLLFALLQSEFFHRWPHYPFILPLIEQVLEYLLVHRAQGHFIQHFIEATNDSKNVPSPLFLLSPLCPLCYHVLIEILNQFPLVLLEDYPLHEGEFPKTFDYVNDI